MHARCPGLQLKQVLASALMLLTGAAPLRSAARAAWWPSMRAPVPLLLAALLLGGGAPARGCTTVIVGKKASTDGSIYIARTDDTMASGGAGAWGVAPPAASAAAGRSSGRRARSCPPSTALPSPRPCPILQNAVITNNALFHPARDGPAPFKGNVNDFQVMLPGPGLAYTAAAKWYTWNTWPLVRLSSCSTICFGQAPCCLVGVRGKGEHAGCALLVPGLLTSLHLL